MASRKEEKERLRKEREERERQEREQAAKKRRRLRIVGAVGAVVVVGVVAFLVLSGGGKKSSSQQASQGLQVTAGPWNNGENGLEDRAKSLNLPAPSDTIYHVHSLLAVYADGKRQTVPQNIGIDAGRGFLASLHTHDDKGIIHQEAVEPYPFTLGQFFTIWGVKFTATQIGAYHTGPGLVLETYANGKKVPDGPNYKMKSHDVIVVGFGKPGSFPKTVKAEFAPGE
jgi:hypothetical protein